MNKIQIGQKVYLALQKLYSNAQKELVDVGKLANIKWGNVHRTGVLGFIDGFQTAQSLNNKRFSLEDIETAWELGSAHGDIILPDALTAQIEFIQSLQQTSWDVEEYVDDEKLAKEANKKSFGEIWSTLTDEQSEYLTGYIDRQRENAKKWQQERMYSEEEVIELLRKSHFVEQNIDEWFTQNKKNGL